MLLFSSASISVLFLFAGVRQRDCGLRRKVFFDLKTEENRTGCLRESADTVGFWV